MMRTALKKLGCVREETAIIGDRMDTDILAGVETEMDTVLVLSGVTSPEEIDLLSMMSGILPADSFFGRTLPLREAPGLLRARSFGLTDGSLFRPSPSASLARSESGRIKTDFFKKIC